MLKADLEITNQNDTETLSYQLFYGSILDVDLKFSLRMYEY